MTDISASCLRPTNVKPEQEPIADRADFEKRISRALGAIRFNWRLSVSPFERNRAAGEKYLAQFQSECDQLVLMRAAQILDEAEVRRHEVMRNRGTT